MKQLVLIVLVSMLTACASITPSSSDGITLELNSQRTVAILTGPIVVNDLDKFKQFMDKNPQVTTLILTSDGGHYVTGREIGEIVYQRKLTTVVDKVCASVCVHIFINGAKRTMVVGIPRSILVFHAPRYLNAKSIDANDTSFQQVRTETLALLKKQNILISNEMMDRYMFDNATLQTSLMFLSVATTVSGQVGTSFGCTNTDDLQHSCTLLPLNPRSTNLVNAALYQVVK